MNRKRPLRIGIEATALSDETAAGIGRVVFQYLSEWEKLDSDHFFFVYSNREIVFQSFERRNWHKRILIQKEKPQSLYQRIKFFKRLATYINFLLPFLLKKDKIDIFIGTYTQFFPLFF